MMKRLIHSLILVLLLATLALPVMAAPGSQGEGGVHFGPYTLASNDSVSGDLTVFGPVTLKKDSKFNGDLTVFGPISIEEGATVDGMLVVMGETDIAGTVEGDVFSAGAVTLQGTASINGDLSAAGMIDQAEGAVVEGDVVPVTRDNFAFTREFPIDVNVPHVSHHRPLWLEGLWTIARAVASILVLSLLALMIVSVWPQQTERAGKAVEEAPLTAFGMGLLVFIVAGIAMVLLAITICLSPFAVLGGLIVGVGILLGWIALGLILGKRILTGLFNQSQPQTLAAAVLGTALLTLVVALTRIFWPIYSILLFVLMPLAAGSIVLTRFGTMPYATQGSPSASVSHRVPPTPPGPASVAGTSERDVAPREETEPPVEA